MPTEIPAWSMGRTHPRQTPYNSNEPPDVLDIVIVKDFVLPVHLTVCHTLSSDHHLPVLIDTNCRASFHDPLYRSDFTRTDWAIFQASFEARLPKNPIVHDEEAIDKSVEKMNSAIQAALVASAPKRRPSTDTRPPLPASIQDEIRLKNRLRRRWQGTRDSALKARVIRLQRSVTYRLNEWRNERWNSKLESSDSGDQSLWKMTEKVMRVPTPSRGLAFSDSEKAEALANSLEAQFHRLTIRRSQLLLRWLMRRCVLPQVNQN
jgi:hypothetical protein